MEKSTDYPKPEKRNRYSCFCGRILSYVDGHKILDVCNYEHLEPVERGILRINYERIHICSACYDKFCEFIGKVPQATFTKKMDSYSKFSYY